MDKPAATSIQTGRLNVRTIEARDLPALFPLYSDAELMRYRISPPWKTEADANKWFERIDAEQTNGAAIQCVMELRDSRKVIGACALFRWDKINQRAELGYALNQHHWGQGYMHEALRALISHAFSQLALRRLEAEVDPRNLASVQTLVKLGFQREGMLRERWLMRGEPVDALMFGLLHGDFPAQG